MEVIEDGNIMDRIPILLQRDLEYYQSNQTVLSETVCRGVVGGRLDFPRNASFAAVKIVLWLEEEFAIAFQQGSGMFVETEHDVKPDGGVAKTSDPDKFVQLAVKSSDSLLEHLHMLVQEALDHADLPVLTATLGAAALVKNTLYCYVQHVEDSGNSERLATLQACYKRYVTMSEAVGERVLDLHCRVLSLYLLQRLATYSYSHSHSHTHTQGTPSVQGWWLYMNGSRKDLWDTVPPRMAQRIFAGMLNETLTILTVRYCQMNTTEITTPMLINDIVNILLCVSQLLPSICTTGSDLAGLDVTSQSREVRDVHAKCNELFKCAVLRGAEIHFIHDAFINEEKTVHCNEGPYPWFKFANPALFGGTDCVTSQPADRVTSHPHELPTATALGLDLIVLLAQPQPNWNLLVKVVMMRECYLARLLVRRAVGHMSEDNARWPHDGLWYGLTERNKKCGGFLCTADGFCRFQKDSDPGQEYARAAGALTYVVAAVGNRAEIRDTLCAALERAAHWADCLDRRQVWCDRRPAWLSAVMALVGDSLKFIPPILVNALQNGASMYQTMSSCVRCLSVWCSVGGRSLRAVRSVCGAVSRRAPIPLRPAARTLLLHILIAVLYQEMIQYATSHAAKETAKANGQPHDMSAKNKPKKHVKIVSFGNTTTSSSVSVDSSHSSLSSAALAIAEALCSIDEDHKHTSELADLLAQCNETVTLSDKFGLEDFPDFAQLYEEDDAPGSNAERASDATVLTSQILMTSAGRDSLRVIYDHIHLHSERILSEVCGVPHSRTDAPLLYVMFHIGTMPFDQYLRGEWAMSWSQLVSEAKAWCGRDGARAHLIRRDDVRAVKANAKCANNQLLDVYNMFKTHGEGLL